MSGWPRLLAGTASGLAASALLVSGALDVAENKSWDWRVQHFTDPTLSGRVAILAVDQASLDYAANEQGLSWPWPRSLYVPAIEYCRSAGARGVVFDVLFTEFSSYGEQDDLELAASIGAARDVALSLGIHQGDEGSGDPSGIRSPVTGDAGDLARPFRSATVPIESLRAAAAFAGNVNFVPDQDGIFRRMPVVWSNGSVSIAALPLAAAALEGRTLRFDAGRLFCDDRQVPLDGEGRMIIPYRGPAQTIPSYSMASAIQSFVRMESGGEIALPPDLLKDRIVFVGLTAPGLLDLRPTPVSAVYPGVEVQATVLEAFLQGDYLAPAPGWMGFLACLLPALLATAALTLLRGAWSSALALVPLLVVPVAAGVFAYKAGLWLPLAAPTAGVLLAFLSIRALDFATEGRQRRFLKQAFRHYLSPHVVEQLVKDPSRLKLGGERKELSIFFSDLAGFTTFSEKLDPERLTTLLNKYLSAMTAVIQGLGGTVDKYEGDAIIAFWNAPLDQPDHARLAVSATVRCLQRLDEVNPALAAFAGSPLYMRIGLHTGHVVVGNLGSEERFDYSMIGDAANLASRLEGLGKVFRSPVIVSEDAWRAAEGVAFGREIGRVRVVGRSAPVRVFQPAGLAGESSIFPWWRMEGDPFALGLEAYYRGDMTAAVLEFAKAPEDPVAGAYLERCRALAEQSLPAPWEGVWEMQSK